MIASHGGTGAQDRRFPVLAAPFHSPAPGTGQADESTRVSSLAFNATTGSKALKEFISRREQRRILELFGSLEWDEKSKSRSSLLFMLISDIETLGFRSLVIQNKAQSRL